MPVLPRRLNPDQVLPGRGARDATGAPSLLESSAGLCLLSVPDHQPDPAEPMERRDPRKADIYALGVLAGPVRLREGACEPFELSVARDREYELTTRRTACGTFPTNGKIVQSRRA